MAPLGDSHFLFVLRRSPRAGLKNGLQVVRQMWTAKAGAKFTKPWAHFLAYPCILILAVLLTNLIR